MELVTGFSLHVLSGGMIWIRENYDEYSHKILVQMTLEQHSFELCESTYTQVFFNKLQVYILFLMIFLIAFSFL